MKFGVLGGEGQVGTELKALASSVECELDAPDEVDLDITDRDAVAAWVRRGKFDAVINCAAYTAVDAAEDDPERVATINAVGAGYVAEACAGAAVPIVYVSTDYVFDGTKSAPYVETDTPNPTGVYGQTKYEGEVASLSANPCTVVLRISWVFSPYGTNFVKTMLRLAAEHDELRVVDDQVGAPCAARSVADALLRIARRVAASGTGYGTYHFASTPYVSWAEFAREIFTMQASRGALAQPVRVIPIATDEYPTKAVRPANSRLDPARLKAVFGIDRADWRAELARVLDLLGR